MTDSLNKQIVELTKLIEDFDKQFGHIDVKILQKKDRTALVKAKKHINNLREQKQMMIETLESMRKFGASDIIIKD